MSRAWEHALLASALVAALFALQGRLNVNLADEGFLWYGVERTARGAVPMRDFYAYDPGRYYFAALFVRLFGPGVVVLRIANAAFQVLGLWCGLRVAARAVRARWALAAVGLLLLLWMYPRHKLYEPSLAMLAAWVATRLLERPTLRRHAVAGATVGLAAFFGKNHALYAACAFALLLAVRWLRGAPDGEAGRKRRELVAFALGGLAGALPLLVMLIAVPGFAASYVSILRGFAAAGSTNLGLPFPWPWLALAARGPVEQTLWGLATGVGLLLLPLAYLPGLARGLRTRPEDWPVHAAPLATAAVGLFYMHHAYARTDSFHLAQAIHPALLALTLWAARGRGDGPARAPARTDRSARAGARAVAVTCALGVFTVAGALPEMPLVQRLLASAPPDRYVEATVGIDRLWVPARTANLLASVRSAIARPPCSVLAVVPHLPGIYPALGRVSPVWDIYPIWPAAGARDRRMRDELERNRTDCVLRDGYLGPGEAAFEETYPESAAWIASAFTPVPTPELPLKVRLWSRVGGPAAER